jgi:hypothetical protein
MSPGIARLRLARHRPSDRERNGTQPTICCETISDAAQFIPIIRNLRPIRAIIAKKYSAIRAIPPWNQTASVGRWSRTGLEEHGNPFDFLGYATTGDRKATVRGATLGLINQSDYRLIHQVDSNNSFVSEDFPKLFSA